MSLQLRNDWSWESRHSIPVDKLAARVSELAVAMDGCSTRRKRFNSTKANQPSLRLR